MKRIPLTQGYSALVDDRDFKRLLAWKWHFAHGYAVRTQRNDEVPAGAKKKKVFMHHEIFSPGCGFIADHHDGNKLNNQRYNLRPATNQANAANAKVRTNKSSDFKGVCWHKRHGKWNAGITINGRYKFLGAFDDQKDA